jgi:tetratricopeptide (TPR) repeat protein
MGPPEGLGPDPAGGRVAALAPDPLARRRADLYALGLILLELFGGPDDDAAGDADADQARRAGALLAARDDARAVTRRIAASRAPLALRPALARCLAPDPRDRYPRAAHLAEDLDRFVEGRATLHARPESPWQRAAGALARRRRALAVAALVIGVLGLAAWVAGARADATRRDRAMARLADAWSGREPDVFRFQWTGRWQREDPRERARVARRVLDRYGVLGPDDWRRREEVAALPPRERADLELWLLEQAWRMADALAARGDPADLRRALAALEHDPAWARLGPVRARRRALRERLAEPAPADEATGPAWPAAEAYLRGLELEPDHARRALSQFVLAGAALGDSFWAGYRAAAAATRIGLYREARAHLDRCLDRYPRNAAILVQQAACLYRLGMFDEAERACERALAVDPDLAEAYRTRAFVRARRAQREATAIDRENYADAVGRRGRLVSHELDWLTAVLEDPDGPWPGEGEDLVARFRSDLVDEAELLVLQGILWERAGKLGRAFDAYEAAVAQNPEHLYARLALANARFLWGRVRNRAVRPELLPPRMAHSRVPRRGDRREVDPSRLEAFTRIVEDPRFEELVAQRPEALTLVTFSWLGRYAVGGETQALDHIRLGLELARRLESSDLHTHQRELLGEIRVKLLYGLAQVRARHAASGAGFHAADDVARLLREAARLRPEQVATWFDVDRSFDEIYGQLLDAWLRERH